MPARRRFGNSESDDNFTIVVDNQQQQQQHQQTQSNIPTTQQNSINQFDEKEKYPKTTNWNLSITNLLQSTIASALQSTKQQQQQQTTEFNNRNITKSQQEELKSSNNWTNLLDTVDPAVDDIYDINIMAARDRTTEFSNAIRSLQGRNVIRAVNIKDVRKAKQLQSYGEFMIIAKHIGKNIASTYSKLEKLTLLAKRKSLFDDRPMEVQELTYIIKGDLNSLNQQIARLQDVSKSQRKSTPNGKHLLSHSSNMVLALQAKLANMSTDFKQILEVRTENLKHQKNRRDQFSQGGGGGVGGGALRAPINANNNNTNNSSSSRSNVQKFGNHPTGSLLFNEQQHQQQQHHHNNSINININDEKSPLFPNQSGSQQQQQRILNEEYDQQQQRPQNMMMQSQQQQQQQQQMMLYHDESDQYVQERAETMQNIESTIVELGGIFQQLAHMVKEQEEMVERIDTNVQDAELNIDAAHGEILRYFQSVTKNRWLMIKIFGVLIFFFIFFVIFLA